MRIVAHGAEGGSVATFSWGGGTCQDDLLTLRLHHFLLCKESLSSVKDSKAPPQQLLCSGCSPPPAAPPCWSVPRAQCGLVFWVAMPSLLIDSFFWVSIWNVTMNVNSGTGRSFLSWRVCFWGALMGAFKGNWGWNQQEGSRCSA